MPIEWSSRLETGIEIIDSQHRRIVTYVNQLEVAMRNGDHALVGDVIEQLVDYTQSHFGFEEGMMQEAGYAFLKPHQKVHELFIKRVSEYTLRAAKGEEVVAELHSTLTKWLLNHIAVEDHDYAKPVLRYLERQEMEDDDEDSPGLFTRLFSRFFGSRHD